MDVESNWDRRNWAWNNEMERKEEEKLPAIQWINKAIKKRIVSTTRMLQGNCVFKTRSRKHSWGPIWTLLLQGRYLSKTLSANRSLSITVETEKFLCLTGLLPPSSMTCVLKLVRPKPSIWNTENCRWQHRGLPAGVSRTEFGWYSRHFRLNESEVQINLVRVRTCIQNKHWRRITYGRSAINLPWNSFTCDCDICTISAIMAAASGENDFQSYNLRWNSTFHCTYSYSK